MSNYSNLYKKGNKDGNGNYVNTGPPDHKKVQTNIKIKGTTFLDKQSKVNIGGLSVYFPFKPYDCQENYMSGVIKALEEGDNALLESPTGTGKTLCLLCSTLAWL